MGNWTPGPWKVNEAFGYSIIGEGEEVAATYLTGAGDGEALANARLISAAPELATSLSELLGVVCSAINAGDWVVDGACDPAAVLWRAGAVITKAGGD